MFSGARLIYHDSCEMMIQTELGGSVAFKLERALVGNVRYPGD